jgi:hypothetical protein
MTSGIRDKKLLSNIKTNIRQLINNTHLSDIVLTYLRELPPLKYKMELIHKTEEIYELTSDSIYYDKYTKEYNYIYYNKYVISKYRAIFTNKYIWSIRILRQGKMYWY